MVPFRPRPGVCPRQQSTIVGRSDALATFRIAVRQLFLPTLRRSPMINQSALAPPSTTIPPPLLQLWECGVGK
jgi:hypothetical protein